MTTSARDNGAVAAGAAQNRSGANLAAKGACAAGVVYFLVHSLRVVLGSELRVMEWLYDDCFYYLIPAKHISERGVPSFDGVTVTSGYHPLWMWLCTLMYRLHGQLDMTYVRSCMGLSLAITGGMLCVVAAVALAKRDTALLWALALAATSYSALNNGIAVMEWPLVVLCWFVLHRLMMASLKREGITGIDAGPVAAAFFVGVAGSLSRTDFGLIAACYLAAAVVVARRFQVRSAVHRGVMAVAGAIAGLGVEFVYNHRMTGEWLQTSAEVKHAFASLSSPFNPVPALWQFVRVLLYLPPLRLTPEQRWAMEHVGLVLLLVCVAASAVALVLWRGKLRQRARQFWTRMRPDDLAPIAAVLGVTGYLVVYGFNAQAAYGWYTAAVTGFVLILASRAMRHGRGRIAGFVVIPLMVCNVVAAEHFGGNARYQIQEVNAGKRMHAEHPNAVMGGGDVGKPSFYNSGTMINLDGLMNNEVYPYLISGRVHCYVLKRHIAYLSGIGSITVPLTDAERRERHEPPVPWSDYFSTVPESHPGALDGYLKTNFDAIRASGECGN